CLEFKLLFRFAGLAVMMYMINNAMSLSTRIFARHLGNLELAAASLSNSGIKLFAYVLESHVVEAMVILYLRHVISYAFTSGETVANTVSELCPFLTVTLILNGIQPVLSDNPFLLS
ncbi:hypothetical protein C3L33_15390, partial [Rhododendron williamsianum]